MPTMIHGQVATSDVYMAVHGTSNPSDPEWEQFTAGWKAHASAVRQAGRTPLSMNVTHGGAPNAVQRALMDAANKPLRPKVAVLNDSAFVRGVITALSWLGGADVRAFKLGDFGGACTFLGVDAKTLEHAQMQAQDAARLLLAKVA